jgi:VWFA-related protein
MAQLAQGLLITLLLSSGSSASQENRLQTPPFRTEAAVVTVDVVAVDRSGDPVSDLQVSDFTITEDGRPQVVQFFQPVLTSDGNAEQAGVSGERPYHYSTNTGPHSRPGRSFVLFFDDVQLTEEQGERAKRAIGQFLADETRHGDLVSLVAPGRGLRWHARFPDGGPDLLKVLASLRGTRPLEIAQEQLSDYEAYRIHVMQDEQVAERVGRRFSSLGVFGREPVNAARDEGPRPEKKGGTAGLIEPLVQSRAAEAYARAAARLRVTLGALTRTLDSMAPVLGRKSVIVVSPGFILDQELALFRQVEEAARRANIAMYFVDARGLEVQTAFASAQFGSPIDPRDVGATNADLALDAEGAATLAESSGGFSVRNRNDLGAGLRRIGRESQAYYLLGYTPVDRRLDGKFRRIGVRVARQGVEVRARKGYYAGGVRSDSAASGGADALEAALQSPYELADLPVRAAAYVFGRTNGSDLSALLALEADLRAFQLRAVDGKLTDVLDLRLLVTSLATGETSRHERAVEIALDGHVPRLETSAWYPLSQPFDLAPGHYQARIAVQDRNSGRVGSLTHDFEVPSRKGTTISSVILTDTIVTPAEGTDGAPKPVLMVRRLLTQGATLYYQFMVFDAGRTANGETRVEAGHSVRRRDGAVFKELTPRALVPGPTGMSRFAGVSLLGAPPGEYELVVIVIDQVRGETLTVREPFAIAESERTRP